MAEKALRRVYLLSLLIGQVFLLSNTSNAGVSNIIQLEQFCDCARLSVSIPPNTPPDDTNDMDRPTC